jgi:outer membrane protein TolC
MRALFSATLAILAAAPLTAQPPETPPDEGVSRPAATVSLSAAVSIALERNFAIQSGVEGVQGSRIRESAARAQFYPKITPSYQRFADESAVALEASQKLPWTGGSLTTSAAFRSFPSVGSSQARSSELHMVLTQPLLRGFGPAATHFDLTNSRRGREGQERTFELSRQRLAVDVARAFYEVVQQRQLLTVARQSAKRGEALQRASEARLQVGLASKLDVFRAQLQAAQAEEATVRSQAALEGALEQFRFLLGMAPTASLEPEETALPDRVEVEPEPVEALVARALARRLDLRETRDQEDDARRSASLARQNLLPRLDLNLALSRFGGEIPFGSAFPVTDHRLRFFFTASYPIERSIDRAARALSEIEQSARGRARQQREIEVETEVRTAMRELERIRKSVDLQRQALEIAEQQHRLATLRYQRGLASNFDVVDAEASLVLARSALIGLATSHRIARLELLRVTGNLDVEAEFAQ